MMKISIFMLIVLLVIGFVVMPMSFIIFGIGFVMGFGIMASICLLRL